MISDIQIDARLIYSDPDMAQSACETVELSDRLLYPRTDNTGWAHQNISMKEAIAGCNIERYAAAHRADCLKARKDLV